MNAIVDKINPGDKFPIMIHSNFRTKSTVLSGALGEKLGIKNDDIFLEPRKRGEFRGKEFIEKYNSGDRKYIVKFMSNQFNLFEEYNILMNSPETYKIRLYRKNVIDNILSFYRGDLYRIFHYKKNWPATMKAPHEMEFNERVLDNAINAIQINNEFLRDYPFDYDITTSFEEIGEIDSSLFVPSPQILNKEFFVEEIRKRINFPETFEL
jgi:hypothetical protein